MVDFNELIHILSILSIFGIFAVFIIVILKAILDFKLKSKMIEKGVSENAIIQMLQKFSKERKQDTAKWIAIFLSLGIGFFITHLFPPFGLHSLVIICFSLSLGFTGYFLFLKKQ
jgi:hypothetical protein